MNTKRMQGTRPFWYITEILSRFGYGKPTDFPLNLMDYILIGSEKMFFHLTNFNEDVQIAVLPH